MKTVLLTDDNEDMIELVQLILAKSGYELKTAHDGRHAIELCMENPPDLVLMDLKMPDMDGFTAIKTLRDRGFDKPIVVLTALESAEDRDRAYQAGCTDYVLKTLEMRDLEPTIDSHLNKGGGLD